MQLPEADIVASLAEYLPVGVWVARAPNAEFVFANSRFREIMGMAEQPGLTLGQLSEPYSIHDRSGALYPESELPFVRALKHRRTVMVDDIVIHRRDGKRVFVRAYARPLFDADETISHVVICFFDISREIAAEKEQHESEARAQHAERMEALGNLAGGIAHDFNNLLATIKVLASGMRSSEPDAKRREQLSMIESVTDTAANLSRSLLAFAGRGKHLAMPLSLNDVVESVATILAHSLGDHIALETELRATRSVVGDRARLEQLVMNLALNARDAMHDGGKLTLRTTDRAAEVALEVEDEGPGVPEELRERIFEPFFTTKTEPSAKTSGLGLATVYGIAESHGAHVELERAPKGGALFRLLFPATEVEAHELAASPVGDVVGGAGTILVVEDERLLRKAAMAILTSIGYRTVGAADGVEAVELFEKDPHGIDAVLLDMSLPRQSGKKTYLAMRSIREDIRVLLTTGHALNEEAQSILDLGVQGFIEKPYSAEQLSTALAEVLAAK